MTFNAAASGGPPPNVQWMVNNRSGFFPLAIISPYGVDATGDLTIAGVTDYMNGAEYQAVYTNSWGSAATDVVTLNVVSTATSTTVADYGPIAATTAQGINLTVTVSNEANGENVTIEDASNNDAVVPVTGNMLAGGMATITIAPGALSGGVHELFAVYSGDGLYSQSQSTTLTQVVDAPATITMQPTNQTVELGSTATFNAAATGYPTPTVQWQVSTDGGNTWSNINGATSPTLTLTDVAASQNGDEFQALFTNAAGSVPSDNVTLIVISGPTVTAISPSAGPLAGGTTVTITGTNLAGVTVCRFRHERSDDSERFCHANSR